MGCFMKNRMILMAACIFLVSIVSASAIPYDLYIGSVGVGGVYDDELEMHYNVWNTGVESINDAKITLWIPELDYYISAGSFDIDDGEKHGQYLTPDVSEIEPGEYLARVMVSSDHVADSKWIWIEIE